MESYYSGKPWLNSYPNNMPRKIENPEEGPLNAFIRCYEQHPDKACIYYFETEYTFRDVMALASSFAMVLDEYSVKGGDRIIIQMQNIPQALICLLAAWLRKVVPVPLNPMYLAREMEQYVTDCRPRMICCQYDTYETAIMPVVDEHPEIKVLVTSPQHMLGEGHEIPEQLNGLDARDFEGTEDFIECLNRYREPIIKYPGNDPEQTACLVYTSGTTGPPKGAIISNRNIGYGAQLYARTYRPDANGALLGVAPLFHVTGLAGHVGVAFFAGIPIILFHRFDLDDVAKLTRKYQASFTVAAITVFIAIMNNYGSEERKEHFQSLKIVISGGAPIASAVVQKYLNTFGVLIHNVYGMTETAAPISFTPLQIEGPVDEESGAYSVGLPAAGYEVRIVDVADKSREVPIGYEGELVVRGPGIISGYWDKPEETANAIIDGELFTGDVAKMDENGWLYIVDRKKDLINVSGYKVWPREVEDVIYQHPAIREAAVVSAHDEYRGETVKAFVSLKENVDQEVAPEEIIQFCKKRMAAYKYPRQVVIMDDLPKTLTGKILRRTLR